MNIYYTAKDIEELADKGVTRLEIGPNVFLTDFAHETAEQLDIKLVRLDSHPQQSPPAAPAAKALPGNISPGSYNKPRGCQHGPVNRSVQALQSDAQGPQTQAAEGGNSVNRLVDIMDKIMKRGK